MNRLRILCCLLAVTMYCKQAWALSSDGKQPMLIEADQAELDDATGISTYRGNVKVTQGTLVLTADTMVVHQKGNDVERVILDGTPATYRQRPDGKKADVHAKALHMEYYTSPELVILLKQAEVVQAGDLLRSERIEYDIENDQVNAGTDQPNERVHITIQPRSNGQEQAPPQNKEQKTEPPRNNGQQTESPKDEPPGSPQPQ